MIKFKYLAILPLLLVAGFAMYFLSKNTPKFTPTLAKPEIQSQINDIKAVQTNPSTGEIEYTLRAKSLTQTANGQDELIDVVMDWTPNKDSHYTIKASRAIFEQKTGDFDFGGGFSLTWHAKDGVTTLTGDGLLGNTKSKQIQSLRPLTVQQGQNRFVASSMRGDLMTKDYQFFGIQVEFLPPVRQQQSLF